MNLKNLTLATALVLAIPSLALVSCKKVAGKITVKITADDANTARTWIADSLASSATISDKEEVKNAKWLDSLVTSGKTNENDAIIKSVKVVYTDKAGKSQTKEFKDSDAQKFATGFDFTDVGIGKEISVTTTAVEGIGKAKVLTEKNLNDAAIIIVKNVTNVDNMTMNTDLDVTKAKVAKAAGLTEANGGGAAEERTVTLTVQITGGTTPVTQKKTGEAGKEVTVEAKATAVKDK